MSGSLKVTITSFSYKRTLPHDPTEHGGGFMFDCRCLPNPGRDPFYHDKTGLQEAVVEFLEAEQEVSLYLNMTYQLVAMAVHKYLARGFEHLMVSFGCTGGQHRSVFMAERVARALRNEFDIDVHVRHLGLEELGYA